MNTKIAQFVLVAIDYVAYDPSTSSDHSPRQAVLEMPVSYLGRFLLAPGFGDGEKNPEFTPEHSSCSYFAAIKIPGFEKTNDRDEPRAARRYSARL
jgi:hypothetical protein